MHVCMSVVTAIQIMWNWRLILIVIKIKKKRQIINKWQYPWPLVSNWALVSFEAVKEVLPYVIWRAVKEQTENVTGVEKLFRTVTCILCDNALQLACSGRRRWENIPLNYFSLSRDQVVCDNSHQELFWAVPNSRNNWVID